MSSNPGANIKKFLPEHYLQTVGKNAPGIIESFNQGIEVTEELIQAAIDQLFLTTAAGKYLIQLGEEQGFVLPSNSGLDVRAYRVLVPVMASAPKQTRITLNQLIQAFYLNERTKPNIKAIVPGPYSLLSGDNLVIETESGVVDVSIVDTQVSDITNVTAEEISAVINASQSVVTAVSSRDRETNLSQIQLISKTFGTGAFVRIIGGTLQNVLKFPNIINTNIIPGTTFNLSKESIYTDILKFEWNGVGTNPRLYEVDIGSVVSMRGFVDAIQPYSKLNGSFEVIDAGFDYFVIRNEFFDFTSGSISAVVDDNIIFTSALKTTILDAEEFALVSETEDQTVTITVPAVPPLARRFLEGSAHLRGSILDVIDFNRSSITVNVGDDQAIPAANNNFVVQSKYQQPDFVKKYYKTDLKNSNLNTPTYTLNNAPEYSVLPYVTSTPIGTQVLFATVQSNEITVEFPDYRHGLLNGWGVTLSNFVDAANYTAADLNQEHVVSEVINEQAIKIKMKDSLGDNKPFSGIPFGAADIYRYNSNQSDGSDFYLDFGTSANAIASGLTAGLSFVLDKNVGTDVQGFYSNLLRYQLLVVTSVVGSRVNFLSGLGVGPLGLIATGVTGARSGYIGGNTGEYYLDKSSAINQERVFQDFQLVFLGYTAPSNPDYLGPYVYDPAGQEFTLTVSKLIVNSKEQILQGETKQTVLVDDTNLTGEFPQSGQIVFDYGTAKQEGPVNYTAFVTNPGSVQVVIDPAYQFKKTHEIGSAIQFIHRDEPYDPGIDGANFPFYLTGTTDARETLFSLVELLIAAGVFIETDVILPELRYDDSALPPYD